MTEEGEGVGPRPRSHRRPAQVTVGTPMKVAATFAHLANMDGAAVLVDPAVEERVRYSFKLRPVDAVFFPLSGQHSFPLSRCAAPGSALAYAAEVLGAQNDYLVRNLAGSVGAGIQLPPGEGLLPWAGLDPTRHPPSNPPLPWRIEARYGRSPSHWILFGCSWPSIALVFHL